jgi:SAM-dependent methyltransferase
MNLPVTYDYPASFARFYDLIYHRVRDGVDNDFFLTEISKTPGKVLEIGVGTGRLFLDALSAGADAYGIDISAPMLEVLGKKLNEGQRTRISKQDMVDFHFDFTFDLVIAPFRVLMHVMEKDDQLKALNNVCRHLNPGGRFIFDTFVPDLRQLVNPLDRFTDFDGEHAPGKKLKRTVSTRPELIRQVINVDFILEWDEDEGHFEDRFCLPMRYFFRYELEHLVERSDFTEYKISGDYLGNELSEQSKEFIVICRK